ncbi:hypothetical protein AHF37_09483 [Paragonimus kellicotti]|nr:hypothetical protein AHF37_09483 [Paragonimus kellicotti]
MDLREAESNLRHSTHLQTAHSGRRYVKVHKQTERFLLVPPCPRLRLEEAFANAERNHKTSVFSSYVPEYDQMCWRKKRPSLSDEDKEISVGQKCTMADLIQMKKSSSETPMKRHRCLKTSEGIENQCKSWGQLTLKSLSKHESEKASRDEIRVRCSGELAQQNRHLGQTGQGMNALLHQNASSSPAEREPSAKRAVPTTEAFENWRRDRLKECGQMNDVLNHSWQRNGSFTRENTLSPKMSKLRLASGNIEPPDISGHEMAAVFQRSSNSDKHPVGTYPRIVTKSAAPFAIREGAAMSERFQLAPVSHQTYGVSEEISTVINQATSSADMKLRGIGPKAKLEVF